jgi:basic amino acid/polyamine antiporter, APA family
MQTERSKINPRLKTFDLTMIVVGLVVGMGIFRAPAEVALKAGTSAIFFLAWFTGAVVSFIGALTFAEIGSRYPAAGGFYKILSHCYHPAVAFMINWVVILSNAGAMAAVAIMGAEYIAPVLLPATDHDMAISIITISSIVILYFINMIGIRTSSRLLNVLMFIKIAMLLLLISAAFLVPADSTLQVVAKHQGMGSMFSAFLMCFIPVFFTYGGYQQTMNFGKDVVEARKTIPRSIFFGIAIILLLYLGVNYSFYSVLGFDGLAHSTTIASDVSGKILGQMASKTVAIVMFLSVMAYVNVGLMSNPRVYFAMAEDNVLPPIFKRINGKTQVQEYALTIFCAFILLTLFFISSFQKILEHVMFFDSIGFMAAIASIFILRRRTRKEGEPAGIFKIKGYPYLPAFFILVYLGVNISIFYANPTAAISGLVLFGIGLPLYYLIKFVVNKKTVTE